MNSNNILVEHTSASGVLAAKLWIREGSRADQLNQKGAHQLLGSLLSRGCGPYSNNAVADLVEGVGAGLRCDTCEDGLLISLKCATQDSDNLLSLLGWMIKEPHLAPEEINLEKELSIQALERQKENPFHLAFDGWRQLAFGSGGYGHDPLGLIEDIRNLKRENIIPLSNGMINRAAGISLAGDLDKNISQRLLEIEPYNQIFSHTGESKPKNSFVEFSLSQKIKKQSFILHSESTGQVVLMLGKPTLPHGHPDDLALRLLSCHLGSGMSSILFKRLREEHGVAYEVGIHHPIKEQCGPFLMHASARKEKSLLTLKLLMESWRELTEKCLSKAELELAKAKFKGQLAHGTQTSSQKAERNIQLRAFNLPPNYDLRSLKSIENLDEEYIQSIAEKYLKKPLLSMCGPNKTLQDLSEFWSRESIFL